MAEGHIETIRAVAVSPCSNLVASGSDDHTVKLWEVPSGALVYTPNQVWGSVGRVPVLEQLVTAAGR